MGTNRKIQAGPGEGVQERARAGTRKSVRASGADPGEVMLAASSKAADEAGASEGTNRGTIWGPSFAPNLGPRPEGAVRGS